jgi:hypothetical protein
MLRGTLVCIALGIAGPGLAQQTLVEYPAETGPPVSSGT